MTTLLVILNKLLMLRYMQFIAFISTNKASYYKTHYNCCEAYILLLNKFAGTKCVVTVSSIYSFLIDL